MRNLALAACAAVAVPLWLAAATPVPKANTDAVAVAVAALKLGVTAQRLVVAVELGSAAASQSVSLMIDLASPESLTLRDDVLQGMKLTAADQAITLSAPGGFRAALARDAIGAYAGPLDLARLSTVSAAALEDRPLAGSLGAGFLRSYDVVIDVQAKELKLLPHAQQGTDAKLVRAMRVDQEGRVHIPVKYGAGAESELLLASDDYDSRIDASLDLHDGPVTIASRSGATLDFARYAAFRPTAALAAGPLRIGVGLLEHFRVEIDWPGKRIALAETRPPDDLAADKAFFQIEKTADAASLSDFLQRYPQSRFREEAAQRLLDGRIAANADDAQVVAAARGYLSAVSETVRPDAALTLVTRAARQHPERLSMVLGIGEATLAAAEGDPKSTQRYRIHRLLGGVRLASGDIDGAWKDYLIAVFGLPDDAQVNLNLARIYEKQGRLGRALSRYQLTAELVAKEGGALTEGERAEVERAVERLRRKVDQHES